MGSTPDAFALGATVVGRGGTVAMVGGLSFLREIGQVVRTVHFRQLVVPKKKNPSNNDKDDDETTTTMILPPTTNPSTIKNFMPPMLPSSVMGRRGGPPPEPHHMATKLKIWRNNAYLVGRLGFALPESTLLGGVGGVKVFQLKRQEFKRTLYCQACHFRTLSMEIAKSHFDTGALYLLTHPTQEHRPVALCSACLCELCYDLTEQQWRERQEGAGSTIEQQEQPKEFNKKNTTPDNAHKKNQQPSYTTIAPITSSSSGRKSTTTLLSDPTSEQKGTLVLRQQVAQFRRQYGTTGARGIVTLEKIHDLGMKLMTDEQKLQEAESLLREAFEGRKKQFGPVKPLTVQSMRSLAMALLDQDKLEEAEHLYRDLLEIKNIKAQGFLKIGDEQRSCRYDLAYLLQQKGGCEEESKECFEEDRQMRIQKFGADNVERILKKPTV